MMTFIETKVLAEKGQDLSLFGALRSGDKVDFILSVPALFKCTSATLSIHSDGYEGEVKMLSLPMKPTKMAELHKDSCLAPDGELDCFTVQVNTAALSEKLTGESTGLFYYAYEVASDEETLRLGGECVRELSDAEENGERQLLIYPADADEGCVPEGIIYHIFVDRFKRSGRCNVKQGDVLNGDWDNGIPQFGEYPGAFVRNNVFFGGDLYGICEKLPYIASLGTSVIYLSPIFDAASNHKYDTADYLTVDSLFGGDDALRRLCTEAKKYGISIMLDGVFNHTGSDSIYFNKEGRYGKGGAYNSQKSPYYKWYGFREYPDDYECWWGVKILPRVNSEDESYRRFICREVLPKWKAAGVKHWRLDVADELSEVFLKEFATSLRGHDPDAMVIGEVWEDATDKVAYSHRRHYFAHGELSSVMNYPLRNAILSYINYGDTENLRRATEGLYRRYPRYASNRLMNFLGTHDTERALTVLGDKDYGELSNSELSTRRMSAGARAAAKAKLIEAYAIICALPGIPCVFYGDEAGVEGYRDPFCRKPFPWSSPDEELTFAYRELGELRRSEKLLSDALFEIESLNREHFAFIRRSADGKGEALLAIINNTDGEITYPIEHDGAYMNGEPCTKSIILPPRGWTYLKIKH